MKPWILMAVSLTAATGNAFGQANQVAESSPTQSQPVLLLVHGCCQQPSRDVAYKSWMKDLEDGLKRIGRKDLIQPKDVRFFWYADLFGAPPAIRCKSHESIPHSSYLAGDRGLSQIKKRLLLGLARLVSTSQTFEVALMRKFLPDVSEYLQDDAKRCEIQDHVIELFKDLGRDNKSVVVAAHSLGSLIMFDVLYDYSPDRSNQNLIVDEVVTFGSMLAYPSVFEALLGKYVKPPFLVPSRVKAWTNVVNAHDLVAFPLEGILESRPGQTPIRDVHITGKKKNSHEVSSYFSDDAFMNSLVQAWCRSARRIGNPGDCSH